MLRARNHFAENAMNLKMSKLVPEGTLAPFSIVLCD